MITDLGTPVALSCPAVSPATYGTWTYAYDAFGNLLAQDGEGVVEGQPFVP